MDLEKVLHRNMNSGNGETSYANNSRHQKAVISNTLLPVIDETLKNMFQGGFPMCFKMVDFGCSSGPNTFFLISHIIDTFKDLCKIRENFKFPLEFQVFLNDLPDNDFNNLFKLMPSNFENIGTEIVKSRCFIYGTPGSFYTRLFPSKSMHFAYSSYSLHWLSKVPEGLEKKNKENIYMAPTSPREVFEAYANQFQRDHFTFLKYRADEILSGGRMVFTLMGRSIEDPSSFNNHEFFTLLAKTLIDLVSEGFVKKDDLYSFNIPLYTPCQREIEQIIVREGSFNLDKIEIFRVPWDANNQDKEDPLFGKIKNVKFAASTIRAFMEPMLASHFGRSINYDNLFERYVEKLAQYKSTEDTSSRTILISLRKK